MKISANIFTKDGFRLDDLLTKEMLFLPWFFVSKQDRRYSDPKARNG